MQRAMALIVRKKVHKKPTNRAIYRPNLDFECGILRGKEENTSQKHFFFLTSGGRPGISWPPGLYRIAQDGGDSIPSFSKIKKVLRIKTAKQLIIY